MEHTLAERFSQLYDPSVTDWPSETDFYRECATKATPHDAPVLEVACGTGCVRLRLASEGARIVGLSRSKEMLDVARAKSVGMDNVCWVQSGGIIR